MHQSESVLEEPPEEQSFLQDPSTPLEPEEVLIGRDKELALIKTHLTTSKSITALHGIPGVGKTALAIAIAYDHSIHEHFHDGILWASLGSHPNVLSLLSHWGTLLGISESQMAILNSIQDWAKALQNIIGSCSMLLVIDDAWTVEDALNLLVGGPNCAYLVTTRFATVASYLSVERTHFIEELNEEQGIILLKQLAPHLIEQEPHQARELVQAVGGLPLALLLMGNYLRTQSYTNQPRRIHAALQRLTSARERLQLTAPQRATQQHSSLQKGVPLSLQSVISVTEQVLNQQAKETLRALSTLPSKPHSFSEEAALAVAACDTETLDQLTDVGLIESYEPGRYMLHQTITDYARLDLQDPKTIFERLIGYTISLLKTQQKNYIQLDLDSPLVFAALEASHQYKLQAELLELTLAFVPVMFRRAWYEQVEQYIDRAYTAAVTLRDQHGIIFSLLYRGKIAQKRGKIEQAKTLLQEGLTLARHGQTPDEMCEFFLALSDVFFRTGDYQRAQETAREGLAQAHSLNRPEIVCRLLLKLGQTGRMLGNTAQAQNFYQEGLALACQIEALEEQCGFLLELFRMELRAGQFEQAKTLCEEGIELARRIKHREYLCGFLINRGAIASYQGDSKQEEISLQEAGEIARQIGHREYLCAILGNIGWRRYNEGNYEEAEAAYREALDLAKEIEHREYTINLINMLGELSGGYERFSQALQYFEEGLSIARQTDHKDMSAIFLLNIGTLHYEMHNLREADMYLLEATALLRQIGQQLGLGQALCVSGLIALEQQRLVDAERKFQEALAAEPYPSWQARIAYGQAYLAAQKGTEKRHDNTRYVVLQSLSPLRIPLHLTNTKPPRFASGWQRYQKHLRHLNHSQIPYML